MYNAVMFYIQIHSLWNILSSLGGYWKRHQMNPDLNSALGYICWNICRVKVKKRSLSDSYPKVLGAISQMRQKGNRFTT